MIPQPSSYISGSWDIISCGGQTDWIRILFLLLLSRELKPPYNWFHSFPLLIIKETTKYFKALFPMYLHYNIYVSGNKGLLLFVSQIWGKCIIKNKKPKMCTCLLLPIFVHKWEEGTQIWKKRNLKWKKAFSSLLKRIHFTSVVLFKVTIPAFACCDRDIYTQGNPIRDSRHSELTNFSFF